MINFRAKKMRNSSAPAGRSLGRLEFEMGLEIADSGEQPLSETVRQAAQTAGGDLVFMLPAANGQGVTAMVRLVEDGRGYFLQVRRADAGFAISEEGDIDADLIGFARASIAVLEQLRADPSVLAPSPPPPPE